MKLRSIICVSAIAAVASASALTSTNTFARLPVTSTFQNALIAIPLAGCGEAGAEIYVTNLVMTANLKAGDKLLYRDGSTYYAWTLAADGGEWQKMATSTDFGTTVTPSAEQTTLPCGKGCWLVRSAATITADSTIYLFGQVNEGAVETAIAAGTSTSWTYTLLSLPYEVGSVDLATWAPENPVSGDTITVAGGPVAGQKTYKYVSGTGWTTNAVTITGSGKTATYSYSDVPVTDTIPAGTAFMYGRKAGADATTINWTR